MHLLSTDSGRTPKADDRIVLIRRIGQRDRAALTAFYLAQHAALCRFLSLMTSRLDIIEEVINDSFWIVWQRAPDFRGEADGSTWLMAIVYQCATRSLRQHGEDPSSDSDDREAASGAQVRAGESPSSDLAQAMRRLPVDQRLVVELAFGGDKSIEDIASILHCPIGTVKARIFHARMRLRHLLPTFSTLDDFQEGVAQ